MGIAPTPTTQGQCHGERHMRAKKHMRPPTPCALSMKDVLIRPRHQGFSDQSFSDTYITRRVIKVLSFIHTL